MHIVSYISKSQRGTSALLHAAANEARNGNLDIRRQFVILEMYFQTVLKSVHKKQFTFYFTSDASNQKHKERYFCEHI